MEGRAARRYPQRDHVQRAPDSPWTIQGTGGQAVARLKPSSDYYSRSAYRAKLEVPSASPQWLVIEFADKGYGLITVSPGFPSAGSGVSPESTPARSVAPCFNTIPVYPVTCASRASTICGRSPS